MKSKILNLETAEMFFRTRAKQATNLAAKTKASIASFSIQTVLKGIRLLSKQPSHPSYFPYIGRGRNYFGKSITAKLKKYYCALYKDPRENPLEIEQMRFSGFIAQEVEKTAELLGYEFSGVDAPKNENDIYGLRYSEFVVPLVKSVQELNEELQSKSQKIAALEQQNKELLLEVEQNSERLKNLESVLQLNKK